MLTALGEGIVGHAHVVRLLEEWAKAPVFSYLFTGPAHVGKKVLAERFVRALLQCSPERELAAHPDVVMFEVEEGKKEIAVKNVRENRARLYQSPQVAPRMVAFVPSMDRLNEEGFNALLKVMEEPPAGAVFVSVAENISRIPATVLSRTVQIPLGLVPKGEIADALVKRGLSPSVAGDRAILARGRPGLALTEQGPVAVYRAAAQAYVAGQAVGHRLRAVDQLRQLCEAEQDSASAWRDALEACTEALRGIWRSDPRTALVLGQGVADASAAIGGAFGPRLMLEAAAVQAARNRVFLPNIFPRTFPLSLSL